MDAATKKPSNLGISIFATSKLNAKEREMVENLHHFEEHHKVSKQSQQSKRKRRIRHTISTFHASLCRLVDVIPYPANPSIYYVAMLKNKRTLQVEIDYCINNKVTPSKKRFLRVAHQLTSAIAHLLHQQETHRIYHNATNPQYASYSQDVMWWLTPENITLDSIGHCKLDAVHNYVERLHAIPSSYELYLAPELRKDASQMDLNWETSVVYSLAMVLLIYFLGGKKPYVEPRLLRVVHTDGHKTEKVDLLNIETFLMDQFIAFAQLRLGMVSSYIQITDKEALRIFEKRFDQLNSIDDDLLRWICKGLALKNRPTIQAYLEACPLVSQTIRYKPLTTQETTQDTMPTEDAMAAKEAYYMDCYVDWKEAMEEKGIHIGHFFASRPETMTCMHQGVSFSISEYMIPTNMLEAWCESTLPKKEQPSSSTIPTTRDDFASLTHAIGVVKKMKKNNFEPIYSRIVSLEREICSLDDMNHLIGMYRELLIGYPETRDAIVAKCKQYGIPPVLRGELWGAILGIPSDAEARYLRIQRELYDTSDVQIAKDVPRCHQYNLLMASVEGKAKLKRILKSWVLYHSGKQVYWQGADSICAPFLTLNFYNEARAFFSMTHMIDRFVSDIFRDDKSSSLHHLLAIFKKLLIYHDSELYQYLDSINMTPEYYTISWLLTIFAHVLNMEQIYILWDTLLLSDDDLYLYLGVSFLRQSRKQLLHSKLEDVMFTLKSMHTLDINQAILDAKTIAHRTPTCIHSPMLVKGDSLPVYLANTYPHINVMEFHRDFGKQALVLDIRSTCSSINSPSPLGDSIQRASKWLRFDASSERLSDQIGMEIKYKRGLPVVIVLCQREKHNTHNHKVLSYLLKTNFPFVAILNACTLVD
mmetsp:Transcript_7100/g.10458  ORF Transcript_7100/g.10458 Transcript_7100/m.10458 type:complete len:873 (-) Transcript_7100:41-2659(-)